MCNLTYEEIVRQLCEAVVNEEETLRVRGAQSRYRCKATYSLHPELCTSPLTMDIVNEVCTAVNEFQIHESNFSKHFPFFFNEVCAKVTRANELMLKVVFINDFVSAERYVSIQKDNVTYTSEEKKIQQKVNETCSESKVLPPSTLWEWWVNSDEKIHFVRFLQNKFANLKVIVAHVRELCEPFQELLQETEKMSLNENVKQDEKINVERCQWRVLSLKPDKSCSYISLTNDNALTITEYTPNGVPFELSADAFCEVNHAMESAIYQTVVEFLCLETSPLTRSNADADADTSANITKSHAFISGRDVNSVTRTFWRFYDSLSIATTCPVVYNDTHLNKIPCVFVKKCALGAYFTNEMHKLQEFSVNKSHPSSNTENVHVHVLITAGRHGIHPTTALSLVQLSLERQQQQEYQEEEEEIQTEKCRVRNQPTRETEANVHLTDFIYISCNVVSLARDLHILKEGYMVYHIRTFDFFPGSSYAMTVVHLRPLHVCARGWCKPLLVIPIGAPCVGKSTCGKALCELFTSSKQQFQEYVQQHCKQTNRKNNKNSNSINNSNNKSSRSRVGKADSCTLSTCIPHSTAPIGSNVNFTHFERDVYFHMCRERQMSLKTARKETHMALITTLQESCAMKVIDTNNVDDRHDSYITIAQTSEMYELQQSATEQKESKEAKEQKAVDAFVAKSSNVSDKYANNYFDVQQMSTWPARRIVYLDSTNGSTEARELYKTIWQTAHNIQIDNQTKTDSHIIEETHKGCHLEAYNNNNNNNNNTMQNKREEFAMPSVLELFFNTPPISEILCRVRMRSGHPSFPYSVEGQQRKVHDIVEALEMDVNTEDKHCSGTKVHIECFNSTSKVNNDNEIKENDETSTIVQVIVYVIAHLIFAPELASLLAPATIKLLLHKLLINHE